MVFSSVPPYLDPSNWQQHPSNNHHIIGSSGGNPLLQTPPGAVGPGQVRPGSMSERARIANIPMPETALKCPRCESTNTKFCYFNNYSLSQPRHFCKTCRRYWTRGGALRNVPVGGGCRRNKRSKSGTTSKSSPASSDLQTTSTSGGGASTAAAAANVLGLSSPFAPPQLRFMSPLGQMTDGGYSGEMGLSYGGEMGYHLGGGGGGMGGGVEPWRMQQFPFMDPSASAMYQFQGFLGGEPAGSRGKMPGSLLSQLSSVKMEENGGDRRQLLAGMTGNEQWNSTTNWTDLTSFTSSSTSNPL